MATAMELALTGREVSAEEALRLGLVSCVVPHDQLMATADRYASMILKNSQRAVRSAKETILDVVGRTIDDALRLETINAYSCLGDFTETKERLDQFYKKKR
jgi:enoyl-CoA hydratase